MKTVIIPSVLLLSLVLTACPGENKAEGDEEQGQAATEQPKAELVSFKVDGMT